MFTLFGKSIDITATKKRIKEAEKEACTNPTEAQIKAGNYAKGHVSVHGLDITIENPKGSYRRGIDPDGKAWETKMNNTYGYFNRTEGKDGDQLDVFLGDDLDSETVFIVNQVVPGTKKFDEHKCLLGFNSFEEAEEAYLSNYSKGWKGLGSIVEMPLENFKDWVRDGEKKTKPAVEKGLIILFGKSIRAKKIKNINQINLFDEIFKNEPVEGQAVSRDGKTYRLQRSKKNPNVKRYMKDDQINLFPETKKPTAFGQELNLFDSVEEKPKPTKNPFAEIKPSIFTGAPLKMEPEQVPDARKKMTEAIKISKESVYGVKDWRKYDKKFSVDYTHNSGKIDRIEYNKTTKKYIVGLKEPTYHTTLNEAKKQAYHNYLGENTEPQNQVPDESNNHQTKEPEIKPEIDESEIETAELSNDSQIIEPKQQEIDSKTDEPITLSSNASFDDVKIVYDKATKSGKELNFLVGDRKLKAQRKYTYSGDNVIKTMYLHVAWVDDFDKPTKMYRYWKENKNGSITETKIPTSEIKSTPRPEPQSEEIKPEYQQVKGKKTRQTINEQVKELLETKTDEEITPSDKQLLIQYTGRGGLGGDKADDISLNEFYTDTKLTQAVWDGLSHFGFTGGTVLEPSSGTGNFIHNAPDNAIVVGVEYDNTSARIAKLLYGDHHSITNSSFEEFNRDYFKDLDENEREEKSFDAVIGNCPFGVRGETALYDPELKVNRHEQYFVERGIDALKEGGVMGMIVPTGIMDNQISDLRLRWNQKAEFLGAVRIPTGAFKNANATVTTDIVFFRKRPQEATNKLSTLQSDELSKMYDDGVLNAQFVSGRYFDENPNLTLGERKQGKWEGQYIWTGELNHDELNEKINGLNPGQPNYEGISVKKESPRIGEVRSINGRLYRFNENYRWERVDNEEVMISAPEHIEEALGIKHYKELEALSNDAGALYGLSRDKIEIIGTGFADTIRRELKKYKAESSYKNEVLTKAVIIGLSIKDLHDSLVSEKLTSTEAQQRASKIEILCKDFYEQYGHPLQGAKLTKYLNVSEDRPVFYLAGAITPDGQIGKILTDPMGFVSVYGGLASETGKYDEHDLTSIVNYLASNNVPGTIETIQSYYTSGGDIEKELLENENIFIDQNNNYAPVNEVCMGEIYPKIDHWKSEREKLDKQLESETLTDGEIDRLKAYRKKYDDQIFELLSRAGNKTIDDLPINFRDAGELFSISMLNDYLRTKLGGDYAGEIVFDEKMQLFTFTDPLLHELYTLYIQKGAKDQDEADKKRREKLNKQYFASETNPRSLMLLNHINGIPYSAGKKDKTEEIRLEFKELENDFKSFLKGSDQIDQITENCNRRYNNYIQKVYDDSIIEGITKFDYNREIKNFDGTTTKAIDKIGKHVWHTVRRFYDQQKGMIAHCVGAGKTIEALLLTMLNKQNGKTKKPLIVTPKSVLVNWVNETNKWFVDANILVVGIKEGRKPDGTMGWIDESPEEKQAKLIEVQNNGHNYDFILMSRDTYGMIDFTDETKKKYIREITDKYFPETEVTDKKSKEQREKALANLAMSIEKERVYRGIYFENLGVDSIAVDESHSNKSLFAPIYTQVSGLSSGESQRALHNFFASRYIRSINNNQGIYSLTATPISNSPLEVFNMLLPFAETELEGLGVNNIDDFIGVFANIGESVPTTDSDGRLILKKRFDGWKSQDALRNIFFRFTDYKTKEDIQGLSIKVPKENPNHIFSTLNEGQKELFKHCQLRLWSTRYKEWDKDLEKWVLSTEKLGEAVSDGFLTSEEKQNVIDYYFNEYIPRFDKINGSRAEDLEDDTYFSIQSDMLKIACDIDWYSNSHSKYGKPVDKSFVKKHETIGKVKQLIDNAVAIHKTGGKQLIFAVNVNMHKKIKDQLVKAGIPANDIVIVNGETVKTADERAKISEAYNENKYKIVIGNYATMGEGLNFQNNTSDIHHLQPVWNYLQIEQGNGRGIRQGNPLDSVNTHYYLAKGSIDGFMNEKINSKSDMTKKFLKGESNEWDADMKLSPEEMLIALSENPETAKRLVEARNAALQGAIKEKNRITGYNLLHKYYEYKSRLNKIDDKESRLYKATQAEADRIREKLAYLPDFEHGHATDLKQQPIILPNHNAVIPVGSIIEIDGGGYGLITGYTPSTGKIYYQKWTNSEVKHSVTNLKMFDSNFNITMHDAEMDIQGMYKKLLSNSDNNISLNVVNRMPKEFVLENKKQIYDNMSKYEYTLYRDSNGNYKIDDLEDAQESILKDGGKLLLPQEVDNIDKVIYNLLGKYSARADIYAEKLYGKQNNYLEYLNKRIKGESIPVKMETTYEIPTSGVGALSVINRAVERGIVNSDHYSAKRLRKEIKDGSISNHYMDDYTKLLYRDFLYDYGVKADNIWQDITPEQVKGVKIKPEDKERAIAIDNLMHEHLNRYNKNVIFLSTLFDKS